MARIGGNDSQDAVRDSKCRRRGHRLHLMLVELTSWSRHQAVLKVERVPPLPMLLPSSGVTVGVAPLASVVEPATTTDLGQKELVHGRVTPWIKIPAHLQPRETAGRFLRSDRF